MISNATAAITKMMMRIVLKTTLRILPARVFLRDIGVSFAINNYRAGC